MAKKIKLKLNKTILGIASKETLAKQASKQTNKPIMKQIFI
jgi:hypothetical protein